MFSATARGLGDPSLALRALLLVGGGWVRVGGDCGHKPQVPLLRWWTCATRFGLCRRSGAGAILLRELLISGGRRPPLPARTPAPPLGIAPGWVAVLPTAPMLTQQLRIDAEWAAYADGANGQREEVV